MSNGTVKLQAEALDLPERNCILESRVSDLLLLITKAAASRPECRTALTVSSDELFGEDAWFRDLRSGFASPSMQDGDLERTKRMLEESRKAARDLDGIAGEREKEAAAANALAVSLRRERDALRAELDGVRMEPIKAEDLAENPLVSAEVQRLVEEGVFSATMDLEDILDRLKAENEALRAQMAEGIQTTAERNAAVASAASAIDERNAALSTKEDALIDAKNLRAKVAALEDEVDQLRAAATPLAEADDAVGALIDCEERLSEVEGANADLLVRVEKAEKAAEKSNERLAALHAHCQHLEKSVTDAEAGRSAAESKASLLLEQVSCVSQERDDALDAQSQQAAQRQRGSSEALQRYRAQLQRLQDKFNDSSHVSREAYSSARTAYEKLIQALQAAVSADEKEELICDLLYEYERRLWLDQADIASLRTVGDIRASDAQSEAQQQLQEALSKIAILRMQLQDDGRTPAC